MTGSTRAARRAGMPIATNAKTKKASVAVTDVTELPAVIPKTNVAAIPRSSAVDYAI